MKRLSLILAALFIVSFVAFAEPAHQNDSPTVAGYTLSVLPQINWRGGDKSDYDNVKTPTYLGAGTTSSMNLTPNGVFYEAQTAL